MQIKSIEISKDVANFLKGKKFDGYRFFNPVLNSNGRWSLNKYEVDNAIGSEYEFLKTFPKMDHKGINEAVDLHDVFNDQIVSNSEDVDRVLEVLSYNNSLIRKDIRFRGAKPSENSISSRKRLFEQGIILLYSKK